MERNVLLGYIPHDRTTTGSSPDVDFNDVFGGPPRRSSMFEMRQRFSFAEAPAARGGVYDDDGDDEEEQEEELPYRGSWSGLREKPVFGEDSTNRRRHQVGDFFDDIFRGDGSSSSTPKKQEHDRDDPFSSAPGSRVLSPARPLPPRADPYGSSVPTQFSLPAKLTKGMDLPTFGSPARSSLRNKDLASDGISNSNSLNVSLSRFSSQGQEVTRNDIRSFYRHSSLSREFSFTSEDSLSMMKPDQTDKRGDSKNDSNSSEVLSNGPQFHFSIYKWASKGVPLTMPLRGGNSSRLKGIGETQKPSTSNGSMASENVARDLNRATPHDTDMPSFSGGVKSFGMDNNKENDSLLSTSTQSRSESFQTAEEDIIPLPEFKTASRLQNTVENAPSRTIFGNERGEMKPDSRSEVGLGGKAEKETPAAVQEARKSEMKPLRSLLRDNSDEQVNDEISEKSGGNKGVIKSNKKASLNNHVVSKKVKKQEEKRNDLTGIEVDKASVKGSPRKSGGNLGRNGVKGKVKEFVKIFNPEVSSKPKIDVDPQSQSSRWKERGGTFRPEKEANIGTAGKDPKMQPHLNKETTLDDASIMELKKVTRSEVDEYLNKPSEKQHSTIKTKNFMSSNNTSSKLKDTSVSSTALDVSKTVVGDADESFQRDFVIKELPQDKNEKPQPGKDNEDMQVVDAKVRKWSNGKEGNIRSLLSTLQYVLWPGSGWKPVPLVDIIEGNAVKRAYQRALLCLHPDKLQQKGAVLDQKYLAEKVFDILQEAWTQFNTLGAL